jgi:hypothetical protein
MYKPGKHDSQRRFTSVAIRCDTSEETRMQLKERGREKLYPSTAEVTNQWWQAKHGEGGPLFFSCGEWRG